MKKTKTTKIIPRAPVIVIMGHIDHGKSTLLDYIRKSNVVDTEAGGITQHLSAYEVKHKDEKGVERKITFLDTPGHEAFQKMRLRGAEIADIAVLIVSAEEGMKEQTLEAFASIKKAGLPFIVAINKIDKPNANIERTQKNLLENEIYLEGMGGEIPWVAISAKEGTGVPELLDMMLLVADLEELTGDLNKEADGVVIETHLDSRKGVSATLIIKNGTLKSGMCVVSGNNISPVRIFEDFQGASIKEANFSTPVRVVGWSEPPTVGDPFTSFLTKKEAVKALAETGTDTQESATTTEELEKGCLTIPIILKTDVMGSFDAIEHELEKNKTEKTVTKVIQKGVGTISENDVKAASSVEGTLLIGFNVKIDKAAQDSADRLGVQIHTFDIIYKLSEWLIETMEKRAPKTETKVVTGRAKILKTFSKTKNKQVLGGRVESGTLHIKGTFRIIRQDIEIGHGTITNLQQQKANVKEIAEGTEFGAELNSPIEITGGDHIESYTIGNK